MQKAFRTSTKLQITLASCTVYATAPQEGTQNTEAEMLAGGRRRTCTKDRHTKMWSDMMLSWLSKSLSRNQAATLEKLPMWPDITHASSIAQVPSRLNWSSRLNAQRWDCERTASWMLDWSCRSGPMKNRNCFCLMMRWLTRAVGSWQRKAVKAAIAWARGDGTQLHLFILQLPFEGITHFYMTEIAWFKL